LNIYFVNGTKMTDGAVL